MSDFDDLDDDDLEGYDSSAYDETPEPEPAPEPEVIAAPAVTTPAVKEAPPVPLLSIDDRIANAARPQSAPSEAPAYSQEALALIAANDPERYAELRDQGHRLARLPWGPDR